MQDLRRDIHLKPALVRTAVDEMSGLQEARAKDHFRFQHTA